MDLRKIFLVISYLLSFSNFYYQLFKEDIQNILEEKEKNFIRNKTKTIKKKKIGIKNKMNFPPKKQTENHIL